jgi:apolipoprotein N-acyltransferase
VNARVVWSRILVIAGGVLMVIGAADPLEGSLVILAGSAAVVLGTILGRSPRRVLAYSVWAAVLITLGVGAMWVLSAKGGLGGDTGRSMWWALVLLPYPVGWLMGLTGLIVRLVGFLRARRQQA